MVLESLRDGYGRDGKSNKCLGKGDEDPRSTDSYRMTVKSPTIIMELNIKRNMKNTGQTLSDS